MLKDSKRHIAFEIAWLFCVAIILVLNFSWISLGILVLLAGIAFYGIASRKGSAEKSIACNVRFYISLSTFFAASVFVVNNWQGMMRLIEDEGYFPYCLEWLGEALGHYFSENVVLNVVLGVISLAVLIFRRLFEKFPFLHTLFRYQFWGTVFCLLFYAVTWNFDLIIGYILWTVLFVCGDVIYRVNAETASDSGTKNGKIVFLVCSAVIFVLSVINPDVYDDLCGFSFDMLVDVFSRWNIFIPVFIVTFVLLIVEEVIGSGITASTQKFDPFYPRIMDAIARDRYILLVILSFIPVVFAATKVYFGYRFAMLIGYTAFLLFCITRNGMKVNDLDENPEANIYYVIPVVSAAVIFLLIEAHYGKLLLGLTLVVTTAIAEKVIVSLENREIDDTKMVFVVFIILLPWLWLNTLARITVYHFHYSAYAIITAAFAVFVLTCILLIHRSEIYQDGIVEIVGIFASVILMLAVSLVLFVHGGSNIDLSVSDDNTVKIEVEAQGEDNSIVSAEYCWLYDIGDIAGDVFGSDENEVQYTAFDDEVTLSAERGLLQVVVEDSHGIRTTKKIWCNGGDIEE